MNTKLTQPQLDAYWMPFTGNRQFKKDPRIIVGSNGCYFTDDDGRQVFDGLSGLWTCGLGHNVKPIAEAIATQAKELDCSPTFQFGDPKAFQLAERITEFMPENLNHTCLKENYFTRGQPDKGAELADELLEIIALHDASNIAAVIVEPLACAAGLASLETIQQENVISRMAERLLCSLRWRHDPTGTTVGHLKRGNHQPYQRARVSLTKNAQH
jgi:adenosylmethionine-8-amino-7-oxononanoate aminotransferase